MKKSKTVLWIMSLTIILLVTSLSTFAASNAVLSPIHPKVADDLICNMDTTEIFNPADVTFYWLREGILQATSATSALDCGTLNCQKGIRFECYYVIDDSTNPVITSNTSNRAAIQNTPPTRPEVIIPESLPSENQTLTCTLSVASTDADLDAITYTYNWYNKTDEDDPWEFFISAPTVPPTITSATTRKGDFWKCEVVANDGDTDIRGKSATVSVQEYVSDPQKFRQPGMFLLESMIKCK